MIKFNSKYLELSFYQKIFPGVVTTLIVAIAAKFLSEHYQTPIMLLALLLGMAVNFFSDDEKTKLGIDFSAKTLLRWGVALLGFRITVGQIIDLGWQPILLLIILVAMTIILSVAIAKYIKINAYFALLSAGATAICGVSAAMSINAVIPNHPAKNEHLSLVVIMISSLSTIVMIIYPQIVSMLGLSAKDAGIFIGASIHDVAQVVGAGYAISVETGDYATVIKLFRVTLLMPAVLLSLLWVESYARGRAYENATPSEETTSPAKLINKSNWQKIPLPPWFLVMFCLFIIINSLNILPQFVVKGGVGLAQWFLIIAIAAIGINTHLKKLREVGIKPILFMIGQTIFMATAVVLLIKVL